MLTAVVINVTLVVVSVTIHYWFLYGLTRLIPEIQVRHPFRIVIGVLGALVAHAIEIWVFALGYFYMNGIESIGKLSGSFNGSLMDCGYFSFATYTTVGFGDIYPEGLLRFTSGIEALTGLVLITWTASFLFLEMQTTWKAE